MRLAQSYEADLQIYFQGAMNMQNRTMGIIATVATSVICGCLALMSCIWGGLIASGTPVDVTNGGVTTQQTLPSSVGFVLLCLSLLLILVPVAVGFFTLRKKPAPVVPQDIPPAS
jgi:hypothetical protein